MTDVPKIIDLPSVIEPHLAGGKLVSYTRRYLTKPGENYGSVMLALKASVQKANGEIEEIPLVAKLPPITNDLFWHIFQPERTCITENAVYKYLSPAIRDLQLEAGVEESQLFDGFAKYYGSRISLDPDSEKLDRDAVLVQENLQNSGFKAGNRLVMFNLEQIKFILRETAKFHALPIALRLQKPEVFDKYIRPYFRKFNMNGTMQPEVKESIESEMFQEVASATNNNLDYIDRIKALMEEYNAFSALPEVADGPYTTIMHCDLWINNLMLQYDENGSPCKVKYVDFQTSQYESLSHDIVFLLFSSVDVEVLELHFDELLRCYYDSFIDCLKSVNVSTEEYSYDGFIKELHNGGSVEICHALFMTKIILADSENLPDDFKDVSLAVLSKSVGKKNITERTAHILRLAEKYKFL